MTSTQTVALVTGANKGLGLALVRTLCQQLGSGAQIYLTARDPERGRFAIRQLQAEGLSPLFEPLDLADHASITAVAERVRQRHGGVDIVIQNGAYAALPDVAGKGQVRTMIRTNNVGTHHVLRAFRPLLRAQARVVVVASAFGTLRSLDQRLHGRFDTEHMTLSDLERVLDEYVRIVEEGRDEAAGWPRWINIPSKVGQVAAMRIVAREIAQDTTAPAGILVNAICPGWMITDASRPYLKDLPPNVTPKSPEEASSDALWPALLPPGTTAPHGELIQFRRVLPWI